MATAARQPFSFGKSLSFETPLKFSQGKKVKVAQLLELWVLIIGYYTAEVGKLRPGATCGPMNDLIRPADPLQ